MADDRVAAAVKDTPLAYLTPENQAAQKSLTLLGNRNANLPNLVQNNHQLPRSSHTAKAKYRFLLSFGYSGQGSNGSWLLGKGDAKSSVDLQVCSPKSCYLIGPVLCTISIHPQSGAFLLENNSQHHSIEYLEANVVLGYQESHILFMTRNHLRFGPLDYMFELNTESEADFSLARMKYIREYIFNNTADIDTIRPQLPCHLLDVLPKPTQVQIGNIIVHQTIAQGAFGLVRIGVHKRTGDVVACKTIRCWQQNVKSVKNEADLSSLLPASTVGVLHILCTWCEHGDSPPCYSGKLEEVHLLMPYAPYDFYNAPWSEIPLPIKLALFHQVLEGLRNIHSAGIIHRDISPKNTLILSLGPKPKAVICDFGKSKMGAIGFSTSLGPASLVAPEVWQREGYTNAIDIYSLGLTILSTFTQDRKNTGPMGKEGGCKTVLERLKSLREQGYIPDKLGALLSHMLSWNPIHRPTAAQALDHEAWHGVAAGAGTGAGAMAPEPTSQQDSDVSSEGGAAAAAGGGSGSGTGGREKRMRRSDGPSPDLAPGGSGLGSAARSGAGGSGAKRVRRSDGPSPDTLPGCSGEEE